MIQKSFRSYCRAVARQLQRRLFTTRLMGAAAALLILAQLSPAQVNAACTEYSDLGWGWSNASCDAQDDTYTAPEGWGYYYVDGGAGNDVLSAASTGGELYGESGNDTLIGGTGRDYLAGGSGSDIVLGGAGDDFIETWSMDGGPEFDSALDIMDGGEGNDNFWIEASIFLEGSKITGGEGNDVFNFYSDAWAKLLGRLIVEGGEGDHLNFSWLNPEQSLSTNVNIEDDSGYQAIYAGFEIWFKGFRGTNYTVSGLVNNATPVPTEVTPEPTEATPAPTEATPAPTEATPAPTEATPAPTEVTPEPTEATPAPTEVTPEPTEATPAPTEATPAPTEVTPEPTEATQVPTEVSPEPTEATPAPTEATQVPTEVTEVPTEVTEVPVEEEKPVVVATAAPVPQNEVCVTSGSHLAFNSRGMIEIFSDFGPHNPNGMLITEISLAGVPAVTDEEKASGQPIWLVSKDSEYAPGWHVDLYWQNELYGAYITGDNGNGFHDDTGPVCGL